MYLQILKNGIQANFYCKYQQITFDIYLIAASFGMVFVDQSYWQSGISAKPGHAVWGFIVGGMCWMAVPFVFSYAVGMAYWGMSADSGVLIYNFPEIELEG